MAKAVQGIQQIRSHEARLLQVTDLFLGAVGAARIRNPLAEAKQAVVRRIEDHLGNPIDVDTDTLSDRFKISTKQDIDSLVT